MNLDGAAPFLMSSASVGSGPTGCSAPTPDLQSANAGNAEVTLAWSDESADPMLVGYKVYYDQAGKAQLVADITDPASAAFTDSGLTNGVEYCYKVTSYNDATCESAFSGILCATPQNQGQTGSDVGVTLMETGFLTGKGKNKAFTPVDTFAAGDSVIIRAQVLDQAGNPVSNATVEITIGGPETTVLNSGPSDADGWAEATWNTQAPNRKGRGGTTPGLYTASTTSVTASGYNWDSVTTSITFTVD
jgi:hypothetical protein